MAGVRVVAEASEASIAGIVAAVESLVVGREAIR
jgi:hypothetical protein